MNWGLISQVVPLDFAITDRLEADGFCLLKVTDGKVQIIEQPDHWVTFAETGWFVEHSLDCRLSGHMAECPYHAAIEKWVAGRMYRPDNDNGRRYCIVSVEEDGFPVLHRKTDA